MALRNYLHPVDSSGGAGGEDDDNDSQGGVGILHKNLTSSSSAIQGLLRKLGAGLDDLLPSSAMGLASSSHQSGRLKKILAGLRANVLLELLNHKNNLDIMLLAAWALTHLVDVFPSSCVAILHYGAISCFVALLLTIEYMELAEQSLQALKKISQVYPSAYLRAGTLMVMLSYLDFVSARVQRVALKTAAHMCKKLPSDASDLVLPMYFFRLENERILVSSLNLLNPLKSFTSPVPALPRRIPENVNPRLRTSCCPRCKEKYDLELVWFYLINGIENDLYCVQEKKSYYFLMSLQIKDQGKFDLDNLQRDSNEIANELCRLKEEMSIDLSLEDVKHVALHYGFVFEKESTIETTYTANSRSMLQVQVFSSRFDSDSSNMLFYILYCAFLALAQAVTANIQANLAPAPQQQGGDSAAARIRDFIWMNPPKFYGSKSNEDP
ncbi:hypothetical protein T459_16955 [Capsicum annuum]|uniref:HECT-type E3 ubiquitin transferase n=1 Tax=Capsicum annuum TaxID=4072 RepID=A0A2G2ZA63_CAPAN|nr:hypothetical protein FXO37_31172 [Capsicum annuum]PHT78903.1 hypothetical protein T459_16955 [Capsicum annuum]